MSEQFHDGSHLAEHLERLLKRRARAVAPVTVILGSSRRAGNTARLVDAVFRGEPAARIVDLSGYDIAPYDYGHRHGTDDFLPLARDMAESDVVVFATPVYWYAMSAQMKTFFDRLSDLTRMDKPLGRSLAGKTMFLLATSSSPSLPDGFETPFAETARYFGMTWGGALHAEMRDDGPLPPEAEARAARFADLIGRSLSAKAA
ncbi:MAG: flavodoxin family protein [Pseudomonadota bacterium]|nr:flavodoxin family protein [Pseudomonadota bacterium]